MPDGNLLVGTGTRPGTGGEVKADEARLYILDLETHEIVWQDNPLPGAQEYTDMVTGPDGLVYGLVDYEPWHPIRYEEPKHFFVFDPETREIIYQENPVPEFGPVHLQQGQRKLVLSPDGEIYILFIKGIARVNPETYKLEWEAESPARIMTGGDWLDGRIYFTGEGRLYSYKPGNR